MAIIERLIAATLALIFCACGALAQDNMETWTRVEHQPYSAIPDLAFLNQKPAGARGRVYADGADLYYGDGSRARFWGANLQAYALFSTKPEHIQAQARRIASLGFNLVRIHHHDSDWVNPNVFGRKAASTRSLDADALASLDLWIEALKSEGIFIWLDLHVGRRMRALDQIDGFEEIAKGETKADAQADIRGYNFVSPSIKSRMVEFQQAYLNHENHLSRLRYKDDPAIIAVLISNENDLTHHFGNKLLPDKSVPIHSAIYMAEAAAFADEYGLNPDETWRSWKHGPSKIFLNDLERRFYQSMITDVRQAGFGGLIATTNTWGRMPVSGLPSLSIGSLIDVHSYGSELELTRNPREQSDMLSWIAGGQVAGMPTSISEWNAGKFPTVDRFILPLRMATLAAHQGWDAPMIYGYSQQKLGRAMRPSNWSVASDPAMMAMLPASALLYRQGHVRHARKTYAIRLSSAQFFDSEVSANTSVAIRTLYEQSAVVVEIPQVDALAWLRPRPSAQGAIVVDDPNISFLSANAQTVSADTGDFSRDFGAGIFRVNTDKTQLVAGAIGGDELSLDHISVRVDQPLAAIAVQSMDDVAIDRSGRLLISFVARVQPVDEKSPSFLHEPLSGELKIRAAPGLRLWDITGNLVPVSIDGNQYTIDLAPVSDLRWLVLAK